MCRSKRQQQTPVSGALTLAAAGTPTALPQPTLAVRICHDRLQHGIVVNAIADTGAQVCVAGPELLEQLCLKPTQLYHHAQLRDVADRTLKPYGSFKCSIQLGNRHAIQDIFFIKSAKACYLSLAVCKQLGLVHQNFPSPIVTIASMTLDSTPTNSTPTNNMHSV